MKTPSNFAFVLVRTLLMAGLAIFGLGTIVASSDRPPNDGLLVNVVGEGVVKSEPAGISCPTECFALFDIEALLVRTGPSAVATVALQSTPARGFELKAITGQRCARGVAELEEGGTVECTVEFAPSPTPAAPMGFFAEPDMTSVRLGWDLGGDDVLGYTLERSDDGLTFIVVAPELSATLREYSDAGLLPLHRYLYRLTAFNHSGVSAPAMVTATTTGTATNATLTIQVTGPGAVSSAPVGITCGADCNEPFALGTAVTLTASPMASGRFDGWTGDCAGASSEVTVSMSTDKTCTATFSSTTPTGSWQTIVRNLAPSLVDHIRSSIILDPTGQAFVAYVQLVGSEGRLSVRREGTGTYPPLGMGLGTSATGGELALGATGVPYLALNLGLDENLVLRWDNSQWTTISPSPLSLLGPGARQPQMVRFDDTLIVAWIESGRIAVRRYQIGADQWEAGAFAAQPDGLSPATSAFDLDLAVDTGGHAVILYSVGPNGDGLKATRETSPGVWASLGDDVGASSGQQVRELGVHVDSSDVVRAAWVEGDASYGVYTAQFDGATWGNVTGQAALLFAQPGQPIRSLSVNRNPALFAFAYAVDTANAADDQSDVVVQQLGVAGLISVGPFSERSPRVGHLSLAMNELDRATLTQSQHDQGNPAVPYLLTVRRYAP